ncbi:type I polyketide synthase [Nocardia amamiensis]|uniref:type I polyketide synthase n=1 Tax=Nocardia amamiensis TaxID=404578 RepID=UPI0008317E65|nr:type I polyketide synthase [Nocardia amamiensis]
MADEQQLRSYLRTAARELQTARKRLLRWESRAAEPVAIIGMGCRYPGGVDSPDDLWQMVSEGRDVISGFPSGRGWRAEELAELDPDRVTYVEQGGFIDGAGDFDARFFGISPREAMAMDPQQRQLLEVTWEAFERAGIDAETVRGSRTGVFVGMFGNSYGMVDGSYRTLTAEQLAGLTGFLMTGMSAAAASGRISYAFGLEGPALTVDTACSSSLVALHQAVGSLRSGESDLAMTAGVTVMATPDLFASGTDRGMAPDGRCKSYAAAADGTGWSEGVGVLLLERLSDAQRNGHPILALVRGTAVNQDGASNGFTAPSGAAQRRVIESALAAARVSSRDVEVVEGHGTGTVLGDPIEANALLDTYGRGREQPLLLGSIKSNMGHSLAAAGVAGMIKMVLAMRHGIVPPTLHVDEPTGHVDWAAGHIRLVTEAQPWPQTGRPRRAAVSSFGITGTNAHVILEEAPPRAVAYAERQDPPVQVWVVSARSARAVSGQARRLTAFLARDTPPHPSDVGISLAVTRTRMAHRALVIGRKHDDLVAGLEALEAGRATPAVVRGQSSPVAKTVVLFPGEAALPPGAGRGLYGDFPVFRAAFDKICEIFGCPPQTLLDTAPAGSEAVRIASFANEVALYRLLESFGLRPDYVLGEATGEIAAAHVAGAWSLRDAAGLVRAESSSDRQRISTGLAPREPGTPLISSATGERADVNLLRAPDYWATHASASVRDGVGWAARQGGTIIVELGSGASAAGVRDLVAAATAADTDVVTTGVLDTPGDGAPPGETVAFATALARAHAAGTPVDWGALYRTAGARRIELPTYAFQHRAYWLGG